VKRAGAVLVLLSLGAGCRTVGPDYQRPSAPVSTQWSTPSPWRPSDPRDAIPKGTWWTIFQDDELNALEAQAADANQSVKVAVAQYEQARALTALALSAIYPQISVSPQAERERLSANRVNGSTAVTATVVTLPFTASYELDLFGKRVRSIEASRASLEASAAVLENVRLVISANLASDYFALRQLDTEIAILDRTADALSRALTLVRARHDGGIASGLDVAQEETLLASTKTQATLLRRDRDQFEHAIAVLIGQPAPDVHYPSRELSTQAPAIDTGLPTDLLERRPDIAQAEREMAAANAKIGVARSAYFPSIDLFGTGGWQSISVLQLFDVPSLMFAVGATVTEDLFTGGARKAQVAFSEAAYNETVASYRDVVLHALAEVEDNLTGLSVLNAAETTQADAVGAASRALDIANTQYVGGLANSLDVISAQQTLLTNQRLAAQIQGERLVATVQLIKALGGGWR
jgi:NodT family efflux transporter outer membrane factor (OMF) lipoprotein